MKRRKPFLRSNLFACLLAFAAMAIFAGLVWVKIKPSPSTGKSTLKPHELNPDPGMNSGRLTEQPLANETETPEEAALRRRMAFIDSTFRGLTPFAYDKGFSTYIVRAGVGLPPGQDGMRVTTRCLVYEKNEGALVMLAVYPLGSTPKYSILHYMDADLRKVDHPVYVSPDRALYLSKFIEQLPPIDP